MATLTVTTARPGKLGPVKYNYGMQGSTSDPQPAAPGTVVQNTVPAKKLQPASSGKVLQRTASSSKIQPAASSAEISRIADEQRKAVEAVVARQKEQRRQQVQGKLDTDVAAVAATLKINVGKIYPARITGVGVAKNLPKIQMPELSKSEQARVDAYWRAYNEYLKQRDPGKKNLLGKAWDKLTFGQDRRDAAAREYAEKELERLSTEGVEGFRQTVNDFQVEQAKRHAAIQASKFKTQAEFTKATTEYSTWESSELERLQEQMAKLEGYNSALGRAASNPLTSVAAKAFGAFSRVTQGAGPIGKVWQYTLGSGDKNIPSLVTAPSRAINFFGNLNTPDRTINQAGGGSTVRTGGILDAWQKTQGQRNFNIRPWVDINWDSPEAHRMFDDQVKSLIDARKQIQPGRPVDDPEQLLKSLVEGYNKQQRIQNSIFELAADPLNLAAGAGAAVKGLSIPRKLTAAVKSTSFGGKVSGVIDAAANSKIISWLGREAKTPGQVLAEAIDTAKVGTADAQKKLLPRINAINNELAGSGIKLDTSIFDDFATLSDWEAKVLQRSVDGKLSRTDRFKFVDLRGSHGGRASQRARLEQIASKWQNFAEQMRLADEVIKTRYGKGKRFYAPRIDYSGEHTLENYNFFAMKGKRWRGPSFRPQYQSATDLRTNAVDRYFRSDLDAVFAEQQTVRRTDRLSQRDKLIEEYDSQVDPLRQAVVQADKKTKTPYGRFRGFMGRFGPTALWKKSVLKYRPAWYVNNFLYNTQAAALSGGPGALLEQFRLMRPRNFRRAMADVPEGVRTKLAHEIGSGRLSKFGNNLENLSRLAAFRTLKRKGFTDDDAVGRVNKYLFDYTVKNWERPLRTVVPFWAWQKNLTRAAVQMPFDRPRAAIGYNRLDQHQEQQFQRDFDKTASKLRSLGFSDAEIDEMRRQQKVYYRGKLKVAGRYYNTPFVSFSEKGLSSFGVNPYFSSLGEVATATDAFGQPVSGEDASFESRFASKVSQVQLARKWKAKMDISSGRARPTSEWIGAPGSEGYGMTKQAQGFDPTKPNYQKELDKGAGFWEDFSAFVGAPRSMRFDTDLFLERKTMQKLKDEYFSVDWKNLPFDEAEAKRTALFEKYGVSRDQFYEGELARYDDDNTKRIKSLKQEAYEKTKNLFTEYAAQPKGTRNVWATKKLKELVEAGYFDTNPFLKSFDWTNPETIAKANKKMVYDKAKTTGNWVQYNKLYGDSRRQSPYNFNGKHFKSAETMQRYKEGFFWRQYIAADAPSRRQLLRENPQYADQPVKSEAEVAESIFWHRYAVADRDERRKLIAENPQYNKRSNWTPEMWEAWRAQNRLEQRRRARPVGTIAADENRNLIFNQAMASIFATRPRRIRKIKFV